jgi:exopolysaccharide production protein ExoY
VKGFGRNNGRSTKGGSLLGQGGAGHRSNASELSTQRKDSRYSRDASLKGTSQRIDRLPSANDAKEATPYLQSIINRIILRLVTATPSRGPADSSKNGKCEDDKTVGRYPHNRQLDSGVGFNPDIGAGACTIRSETISAPLWKRILDVTCIVLTLPGWLPLMLLVMCFIRLTSSGPIFYRQERVGFRRKRFMIFKFRTMHLNAETRTHEDYFASLMNDEVPMTKLDAAGDSRLIPGARFLRASGLDELPQIFNVLRGDMSLVGPRPCLPNEFNRYEAWQQRRVNAPPGLTGYWQVNGKNKTTFNQMMVMDLFYVDKMSLWFDLRIILKTIPVLISETIAALKRYRSRRNSRSITQVAQPVLVISSHNSAVPKR